MTSWKYAQNQSSINGWCGHSFILVSCFLHNTSALWEAPVIFLPVSYMLADFYHPRRWKRCIQNFHVIWSPVPMCSWAMIHGGTCRPGSAVLLRVSQVGGKTTSQLLSWVFIKARIEFLASFPQLLGFHSAKNKRVGDIFHFLNRLYIWCKKSLLFGVQFHQSCPYVSATSAYKMLVPHVRDCITHSGISCFFF